MAKEEVGLEVVGEKGKNFIVKVPGMETFVEIENTFAEMFSRMEISPANPSFYVFLKFFLCFAGWVLSTLFNSRFFQGSGRKLLCHRIASKRL